MSKLVLSADIGGTNTRLQVSQVQDNVVTGLGTALYVNTEFTSFVEIIRRFFKEHQVNPDQIYSACFAVAGPIVGHTVKFTNLPWFIDREELKAELGIAKLELVNDLQAVGYGIDLLRPEDLEVLQSKPVQAQAPQVIIGAGTGLGIAIRYPSETGYRVQSTEGGHIDFAPTDDEQMVLLQYMRKKLHRVSAERIVSGIGLTNIYKFVRLHPIFGEKEHPMLRLAGYQSDNIAATISEYAIVHKDPMAMRALRIFISAYGSVAGNLALTTLCFGGLYLTSGIAPKLLPQLRSGGFMTSFLDKGRMSKLISEVPVFVVMDTLVGLKGAALYASKL